MGNLGHAISNLLAELEAGNSTAITAMVVVLTAVTRVSWSAATAFLALIGRLWDRPIRLLAIELKLDGALPRIKAHRCLVVRHCSEDYLPVLVSERELWEARLLNRSIGIYRWPFTKQKRFRGFIFLPVHRRLGTQFKCYFDFHTKAEANRFRKLTGVSSKEQVKRGAGYHRVWLLLDNFETTKVKALSDSSKDFVNNFAYPF